MYMEAAKPLDDFHRQLVQQLADADWSVHQIFTAQTAQVSLLNTLTLQLSAAGADVAFIIKSSAQCARTLATLTRYENGKRRTAKLLRAQLADLQAQIEEEANSNKPKPEPEIGFVHPKPIKPVSPAEFARQAEAFEAAMSTLEAEKGVVSDEEAFALLQKFR
jgi:hypothetical protein